MEDHRTKLRNFCRLCPNRIIKSCHKNNFKLEISQVHNIDISNEDNYIFPENICSSCRLKLSRIRKSDQASASFCDVPHFASHCSESCCICDFKSGRPKKQRKRKRSPKLCTAANSDTDSAPEISYTECVENLNGSYSVDSVDNSILSGTDDFVGTSSSINVDDCSAEDLTLKNLSLDTLDDSVCSFGDVTVESLNVDRFSDSHIVKAFICSICRGVPFEPIVSSCNHIFCVNCIKGWLNISSACPVCRNCIDETDIMPLSGNLLFIYESLEVKCSHSQCNLKMAIKHVKFHELSCQYTVPVKMYDVNRSHASKLPLDKVSTKHLKHRRLKPVMNSVNEFCTSEGEDKTDVLFALLKTQLKDSNDPRWKDIDMLWRGSSDVLSVEQCLAIRVSLLQSKSQYRKQYDFLKSNSVHVLQSPNQIEKIEANFMPGNAEYSVAGNDFFENRYKSPTASEPINILSDFCPSFIEFPVPNCLGVRWSYFDALAKTMEELSGDLVEGCKQNDLNPNDPSILFVTTVKDGGDGMGDISIYKEKCDRTLPDKAFRFSFCVIKVEAISTSGSYTVFEEQSPNSSSLLKIHLVLDP